MRTRELTRPPRILPLYLRAASTLVPGASRLPGLPGGGDGVPELELTLHEAGVEPERLARYRELCGYSRAATLPPTYPHVLAFPLHMALMADPGFPLPAVGLIHVENQITQRRALDTGERLELRVHPTPLEAERGGRAFAIVTSALVGDELVWEERSKMLWRGGTGQTSGEQASGGKDGGEQASGGKDGGEQASSGKDGGDRTIACEATWRVAADVGRRYGAVSGDRNPIHLHALAAKAFGFPRAIAHGMWTKARCLAALQAELPEAFTTRVRFRKPVLLPASVSFECDRVPGGLSFALRSATREVLHLEGRVQAAAAEALR
jgi:acyl dehydratase